MALNVITRSVNEEHTLPACAETGARDATLCERVGGGLRPRAASNRFAAGASHLACAMQNCGTAPTLSADSCLYNACMTRASRSCSRDQVDAV